MACALQGYVFATTGILSETMELAPTVAGAVAAVVMVMTVTTLTAMAKVFVPTGNVSAIFVTAVTIAKLKILAVATAHAKMRRAPVRAGGTAMTAHFKTTAHVLGL